jgi:hypothetical protein
MWVCAETDGVCDLNEKGVSRWHKQFRQASLIQARRTTGGCRRVLKNFLNADGTLKQIPPMGNKLLIILNFIVDAFAFDATYTEKEVNTILRRFHIDTAALRRYLVDYGLMSRESDGTRYWRIN